MRNITDILGAPAGLGTGTADDGLPGSGRSGPRGVESVIEYNGLYLNVREWIDTFLITTIGGIDDADVRDNREVNPGYHGEVAFESFYGGRTITLSGKLYCKTLFKLRDMQQALRQAFAQLDRELPLVFRTPDPNLDLMLYCRKSQQIQMAEEQRTANHFERAFQVTLRAANPRFLSVVRARANISFTDVVDFSTQKFPTVETFSSFGVLAGYNERGGGFEVVNDVLQAKAGVTGYTNYITQPDFDGPTSAITTVNSTLAVAGSGGAGDNGKYGVLTTSSGGDLSAYWTVAGITPGSYYSALGYVRSPGALRTAELRVEWLDSGGAVLAFQRSTVPTTGSWQRITMESAVPPAGAVSSRWHLRFNGVLIGEAHHIDRMMVVGNIRLPVEGYFDGDSVLANWTGAANNSTSTLAPYSMLTTNRTYGQIQQQVKFVTPATLPNPRVGAIRLMIAYIDDNNQVYATFRGTGSATQVQAQVYTVVNGVESQMSGWVNINIDPSKTYWLRVRDKNNRITTTWFAADPATGVAPVGTAYNELSASERTLFGASASRQIGLVAFEEGGKYQIDEWSYKSEDDLLNWNVLAGHGSPYVNAGKLWSYDSTAILMTRKDLGYKVENCTLTMKIRAETGQSAQNLWVGGALKVLDANNVVYCRVFRGNGSTGGMMLIDISNDGAASNPGQSAQFTAGDFPNNADRWIRCTINGNAITSEFWKTDPALGGSASYTASHTMTGANATKFGTGVKGDVGLSWTTGGANLASIDDFTVQSASFNDTAFMCHNDGNFPAQPQIYVTGPLTNLRITNEANHDQLYLPTTIPNGERWCIDIPQRRMYRVSDDANRFQYLDVNSDWLVLEPGSNYITTTATGMLAASQVEFYWHHTVM